MNRQERGRLRACITGAAVLAGSAAVAALLLGVNAAPAEGLENRSRPVHAAPMAAVEAAEPEEESPAVALAKTIYGEARGCSTTEQAAVAWCVLNRVDDESGQWPDDVVGVVTQPSQFHGYDEDHPVVPELLAVAEDVLARWEIEDTCVGDVGRVLPEEYTYFSGDGRHNWFRTAWDGGETWDWGLESPYGE